MRGEIFLSVPKHLRFHHLAQCYYSVWLEPHHCFPTLLFILHYEPRQIHHTLLDSVTFHYKWLNGHGKMMNLFCYFFFNGCRTSREQNKKQKPCQVHSGTISQKAEKKHHPVSHTHTHSIMLTDSSSRKKRIWKNDKRVKFAQERIGLGRQSKPWNNLSSPGAAATATHTYSAHRHSILRLGWTM